jgi:acetyltransferase-like isoleucine patch superfamily enzyme
MSNSGHRAFEDPLSFGRRIVNRLYTQWLLWTYPFLSVGRNFRAHSSCDLRRAIAPYIKIGDAVWLDRDVWLNIPFIPKGGDPVIVLDDEVRIGRRCMISAQNRIHVGRNAIFAPSVLVMDHNHEYEYTTIPISAQGTTAGGTIRIEEGCWFGYGAVIVCSSGELVIGKNCVIGANSVVTRSIPPFSVVTGNPGRVVRHYDPAKGMWVLGS